MTAEEEHRQAEKIRAAGYSPAFPLFIPEGHYGTGSEASYGLTMRDWFAANAETLDRNVGSAALATLTGEPLPEIINGSFDHWQLWARADAAWRYIQADAMLQAREAAQ